MTRPESPADALYLPVEVIDEVLNYIVLDNPRARATVSLNRRQLCLCSRTCRHWAASLRPRLFGLLTLRTLDELRELVDLAGSAHSRVGSYLSQLRVEHTEKSTPWYHAIYLVLLPKLPIETRTSLRVELTIGPCIGPQRSFLQNKLPRQLPTSIYMIHRLNIVSTYLRSFADLLELVGSLPLLDVLYCFEVSCEQEIATMTELPCCREAPNLREVVVMQCSFGWEALWLFVGRRRLAPGGTAGTVPRSSHRSARADMPTLLGRMMHALTCGGDPDPATVWGDKFRNGRFNLVRRDEHIDIVYRWVSSAHLLTNKKLPVPGVVLSFGSDLGQRPGAVKISVDCYAGGRYEFGSVDKCDWKEMFSLLLDQTYISVTLGLPSGDSWHRFLDELAPESVQALVAAGKLSVAYWDNRESTWSCLVGNDSAYHFYTALPILEEEQMMDDRSRFVRMMETSW